MATTKVKLLDDNVVIPSASVATTQSASDNTTKVATTAYVTTAIANLADSAPSTLNTLNELAAALGDDANFSTTVTNSIAAKLPLAGGTMTGALAINSGTANVGLTITSTDGTGAIKLADNAGNVELSAVGNDLHIQNAGGTAKMVVNNSGNVGIGTTSPGALLHLNGTGDAIRVESTNSGAGGAQVDLLHFSPSPADEDVNGTINFGGYYSGSSSAYGAAIRSVWTNAGAKEGRLEFYTRDDNSFPHHMQINHHGGIAMGENNSGYDGQILSIKAGTGNNVLYGESSDANCIVSLRDNSSTANIGYGATGNAHVFSQDGTQVARISTGSADKYSYSSAGLGGNGTNLVLEGDDSEIKMSNNFIHSDNSGLTQMTIRCGYGVASTGAELSLDAGRITFNTGTSFTERMRIQSNGRAAFFQTTGGGALTIRGEGGTSYIAISFTHNSDNGVGYIQTSSSAVTYSTSSDYRLKENIVPMENGLERIQKLKPVKFNWKLDGKEAEGFLAHEVQEAGWNDGITGSKDDYLVEEGQQTYQGMDYGRITPLLVKAIQEQQTIIDDLKSRIETLEG